jgi:hypothetical protein
MATPMCISDDGNKATFIGTFLETGDNVRLCDDCMPQFCAAVFERMTGVDMAPAIYLASQEGQASGLEPEGSPGEVAYPPDMEPRGTSDVDPTSAASGPSGEHGVVHGAPSDEPPAPAPADTDMGATVAQDAVLPDTANTSEQATPDAAQAMDAREDPPPTPISRGKRRAA